MWQKDTLFGKGGNCSIDGGCVNLCPVEPEKNAHIYLKVHILVNILEKIIINFVNFFLIYGLDQVTVKEKVPHKIQFPVYNQNIIMRSYMYDIIWTVNFSVPVGWKYLFALGLKIIMFVFLVGINTAGKLTSEIIFCENCNYIGGPLWNGETSLRKSFNRFI